jgi:hypothetical protein
LLHFVCPFSCAPVMGAADRAPIRNGSCEGYRAAATPGGGGGKNGVAAKAGAPPGAAPNSAGPPSPPPLLARCPCARPHITLRGRPLITSLLCAASAAFSAAGRLRTTKPNTPVRMPAVCAKSALSSPRVHCKTGGIRQWRCHGPCEVNKGGLLLLEHVNHPDLAKLIKVVLKILLSDKWVFHPADVQRGDCLVGRRFQRWDL